VKYVVLRNLGALDGSGDVWPAGTVLDEADLLLQGQRLLDSGAIREATPEEAQRGTVDETPPPTKPKKPKKEKP
jgi:hypothetical protein